jgi:hypothetical protein
LHRAPVSATSVADRKHRRSTIAVSAHVPLHWTQQNRPAHARFHPIAAQARADPKDRRSMISFVDPAVAAFPAPRTIADRNYRRSPIAVSGSRRSVGDPPGGD